MRTSRREAFAVCAFAAAVILLLPFAEQALGELSRWREPMKCGCVRQPGARLNIVYLHGLDTYGPSWHEVRSRETMKAIARVLRANVAFPRSGGMWPKASATEVESSRRIIETAADTCFGRTSRFGVVGFSDGGNLANQIYLECRPSRIDWIVSIGSEGSIPGGRRRSLSACGAMTLIAGRHEPTLAITRGFWRQLRARESSVDFIEHAGPHDIPFDETLGAVRKSQGER